jgi:opacity protein-like surface antigen
MVVSALAVVLTAEPGWAQKWEFGAGGGGSFYKSQTVTNGPANGSAGFSKGFVATAILGQNLYRHLSGEIRYTYGRNDLALASGGAKVSFAGQSHAICYEFLIHSAPAGAKVRPYVAAGGGAKMYQGTGTETTYQNLSNLALLTRTQEWKGLLTFGGGVKYQVSKRALLRVEFRDYFTQFPKQVIEPNRGSKVGSWIHNFVPMAGLTFLL